MNVTFNSFREQHSRRSFFRRTAALAAGGLANRPSRTAIPSTARIQTVLDIPIMPPMGGHSFPVSSIPRCTVQLLLITFSVCPDVPFPVLAEKSSLRGEDGPDHAVLNDGNRGRRGSADSLSTATVAVGVAAELEDVLAYEQEYQASMITGGSSPFGGAGVGSSLGAADVLPSVSVVDIGAVVEDHHAAGKRPPAKEPGHVLAGVVALQKDDEDRLSRAPLEPLQQKDDDDPEDVAVEELSKNHTKPEVVEDDPDQEGTEPKPGDKGARGGPDADGLVDKTADGIYNPTDGSSPASPRRADGKNATAGPTPVPANKLPSPAEQKEDRKKAKTVKGKLKKAAKLIKKVVDNDSDEQVSDNVANKLKELNKELAATEGLVDLDVNDSGKWAERVNRQTERARKRPGGSQKKARKEAAEKAAEKREKVGRSGDVEESRTLVWEMVMDDGKCKCHLKAQDIIFFL